jgi:flap endonuclease-1
MTGEPLRDSQGRITSHLSGLLYRTTRFVENGINVVYVFDGKPPAFKHKVIGERTKIREEAAEKLEKAREEGDVEKIRLYSQAAVKLTGEMIEQSKKLLDYMGIQYIQAPSEGEAQAAYMASKGVVWASGSQDWDSLLFGAPRFVKNLAISGRRKVPRKEAYIEVRPEIIELQKVLNTLEITREQLVITGILIGTDYNPKGVKGFGPKHALKLVKEKKTLDDVFASVNWEFEIKPQNIFSFFMNPPVEDCSICKKEPDFEKLREFMAGFDFSGERIDNAIESLKKSQAGRQSGLGRWLNG